MERAREAPTYIVSQVSNFPHLISVELPDYLQLLELMLVACVNTYYLSFD